MAQATEKKCEDGRLSGTEEALVSDIKTLWSLENYYLIFWVYRNACILSGADSELWVSERLNVYP